MNISHQLLVHPDVVNILNEEISTIKRSIIALLQTSMDVGLEANTEVTKYTRFVCLATRL
jgi:hypothetical protein